MPTLLDELVVQGVRQGLSKSVASAIAGGAAGTIGNLASRGMLSNLTFSDPGLQATVARLQGQLPGQPAPQTPPAPNTVDELTVTAQAPDATSGALGQVLANSAGASGVPAVATAPSTGAADTKSNAQPTDVSQVDVIGKAPSAIPPAAMVIPAGAAGAALLASGGGGGGAATPPPNTVDELTVTAAPKAPPPVVESIGTPGVVAGLTPTSEMPAPPPEEAVHLDPQDLMVPAALGVGALTTMGNPDITPPGGGLNITPGDVVAGGLLAGGLLGGTGSGGSAAEGLKGLADSSAALAGRLGNIAQAGMAGDIDGRGLNSIGRMVRKAQAAIRQRYAAMNMSGSTAEIQDLNAAAEAGVDLQFKVGQEMAQTGLNAIAALTGQSAAIYTSMLNAQTAKNTALGNAIANFAASLVK